MRHLWKPTTFILALLSAVACGKPTERDALDAVEPLEPNLAPAVEPVGDETYPEGVLSMVCGEEQGEPSYHWCHARGYVHAPIADVFETTRNVDVNVDRREVDSWVQRWDEDADTDYSYFVDVELFNVIAVEYTLKYGHNVQQGTLDDPELTWCLFDLTQASSVLEILRGSIVLRKIDEDVTEYEYIEHLKAPLRDTEQVENTMRDIYADVLAHVHGEPLPDYE